MNVTLLNSDELEVEFQVRNIKGSYGQQCHQLNEQLIDESNNESEPPNRPHEAAYKDPRREIKKYSDKLVEIKDLFHKAFDSSNTDVELNTLWTRTYHVMGRLGRLDYSKTVRNDAKKLLDQATKLFHMIDKRLSTVTLDTSNVEDVTIKDIENLEITRFVEGTGEVASANNTPTVTASLGVTSNTISSPVTSTVPVHFSSPTHASTMPYNPSTTVINSHPSTSAQAIASTSQACSSMNFYNVVTSRPDQNAATGFPIPSSSTVPGPLSQRFMAVMDFPTLMCMAQVPVMFPVGTAGMKMHTL